MHPNTLKFIREFEEEATRRGSYRNKLGRAERIFLTYVWGPMFNYQYDGLKAEYPFQDFKGGNRFIDFVFLMLKLVIEIDGFSTHAKNVSSDKFDDHLQRQNDLILSGWTVLRFSARQVENNPKECQRQIAQAIGLAWIRNQENAVTSDKRIWQLREKMLIQIASEFDGKITSALVAQKLQIHVRTAYNWINRFVKQNIFQPVKSNKRTIAYELSPQYSEFMNHQQF